VYWSFDFQYSEDALVAFRKLEAEYPSISKFSFGILATLMAIGFILPATLMLPYIWPIAAIALVPLCFVYSGYNARKKFLFLERLKGEEE
jgi:hypothetical protein